jgi:putative ABC transport system permease protein
MSLLRLPLAIAVQFYQSLFLAMAQIWANKTRAMLTTIGIVIGVASVTAVIAALTGLKSKVLAEFETLGTNKVFIAPDRPDTGPMRNAPWPLIRFQPDLFDGMLDHCPSLKSFTRTMDQTEIASFQTYTVENVRVTGIEPAWHDIEKRGIVLGRPFSMIDNERSRPVCLINKKLQDKLGLPLDCTGSQIIIRDRRYLIVGVIEDMAKSMFNNDDSGGEVYLPFTTCYEMVRQKFRFPFMMVVAAAKSPDLAAEAKAEVTFFLRKRRHIAPDEPNTFRVEFVDQFVQVFNKVANAITVVAAGIVGISLLVGGVGIMNIMLVSVSERTREIGLRKAVGARPSAILMQFLVEAVALCFMGGMIGLIIGQALTFALKSIPNAQLDKAYIPGWAIVLSFGFAASVGLIFGMFPAIKAARLDPIEALRHE